ncbi:hypothetical protein SCLARK_00492 [Spiroplasma clarkii]|uniref:Antitoxin SocA-like Panacea domain-containing protein n=1 Tax=Spiroplasma clarkii TaxID=2139 RepID=A0A1Y0L0F8_9MOLU|nr:type II toxin-antitoxin system antitoxin SocA domain-containing protein [Spiroplasma clarkii]ARU91189.1 hypothetical protein SCLARK_00492 [Spiroplasma clarkii]ATX70631.1 hypothetical protein SCLAR_v1c03010 [Spiroplasma clarkii]
MFFYLKADFIQYVINLIYQVNKRVNCKITQIQIQKIIYIVYAYFLLFVKPIAKIDFETWRWGPVIYVLWKTQTKFKAHNVKLEFDQNITNQYQDADIESLCLKIIEFMLKMQTWDIVEICHEQTPWKKLYVPNRNIKIKDEDIYKFHKTHPDNFFDYLHFVIENHKKQDNLLKN